ncbi:inner membrane protein YpjD [Candidatus Hydrogenedentota bacterium]
MISLEYIIFACAVICLAVGTFTGVAPLTGRARRRPGASRVCATAGILFFTSFLVSRGFRHGGLPLTTSAEVLSFAAWSIWVCYFVSRVDDAEGGTGPLCLVPALVFACAAVPGLSGRAGEIPEFFSKPLFVVHVVPAFLGYGAFAVGFVSSMVYLFQEKQLKNKSLGALTSRLPSLECLEASNYRMISWGFVLFTISLACGIVLAISTDIWADTAWKSDPKIAASCLTWFIYAVLFFVRRSGSLRGRLVACISIAGFVLVMISFVGIRLLSSGAHTFT